MPYVTPTVRSVGDAVTAADYNIVANDVIQIGGLAQGVFTNEAARDAAITSPTEGMIAYLTAPTVPAATGASTFLPSGIRTIYNGSVWVCVTPISAFTLALGTTTSTSYTATLSGSPGTNPSVTLVTGTSALLTILAEAANSGAGAGNNISFAVSGATTLAANANNRAATISAAAPGYFNTQTATTMISGLTAGTNTFTLQYAVSGNTGSFQLRNITAEGIA